MKEDNITVGIIEDDLSYCETLRATLKAAPDITIGNICHTAEEALQKFPHQPISVMLVDILLPFLSGIECVARLQSIMPNTEFLMLTVVEDYEQVYLALRAGANGYIVKNGKPPALIDAIRDLRAGESAMSSVIARKLIQAFQAFPVPFDPTAALTLRERQVLEELATGGRNKEIASRLDVSPSTIRKHLYTIYKKLHVTTRARAVQKLGQSKVIQRFPMKTPLSA
jgi:DNA-binding NarL/FixJ family response regulator